MRTERKIRILEKLAAAPYADPAIEPYTSRTEKMLGRPLRNPRTGGKLPIEEQYRLTDAAKVKKYRKPDEFVARAGKWLGRTLRNPKTGGQLPHRETKRLMRAADTKYKATNPKEPWLRLGGRLYRDGHH